MRAEVGKGRELTASIGHCDAPDAGQAAAAMDPVLAPAVADAHLPLLTQAQTVTSGRSVPGVQPSGGIYPGSFGAIFYCPVDPGPYTVR